MRLTMKLKTLAGLPFAAALISAAAVTCLAATPDTAQAKQLVVGDSRIVGMYDAVNHTHGGPDIDIHSGDTFWRARNAAGYEIMSAIVAEDNRRALAEAQARLAALYVAFPYVVDGRSPVGEPLRRGDIQPCADIRGMPAALFAPVEMEIKGKGEMKTYFLK